MIYKKLSFLAVVALFFMSFTAQATHWRFGQLTWKPAAAANTAEFTLTAAFRLNGNYGLPGTPVVGDVITEFQGPQALASEMDHPLVPYNSKSSLLIRPTIG